MQHKRVLWSIGLGLVAWSMLDQSATARYYRRGGGYGGGYGGTPQSYYMNAMANVVRAQGQAAVGYSQAAINIETARSQYIDNQKKWAETYFERKRIYAAYAQEKHDRDMQVVHNYLANRQSQAPARLSFSQLDPATGKINWPDALRSGEYAADCRKVEELFALRSHVDATLDATRQIQAEVATLRDILVKNISSTPPSYYIPARKFLDSLAYEATFPTG